MIFQNLGKHRDTAKWIPSTELKRSQSSDAELAIDNRALNWESISHQIGKRYKNCTLKNYEQSTDDHKKAAEAVQKYQLAMNGETDFGNLVIVGPVGTGKDHLMTAVMRYATFHLGLNPAWCDGQMLFASIRDAYTNHESESDLLKKSSRADILAISDPLPNGDLSEHQKNILGMVLDARDRAMLPTLATVNVPSREALYSQLGERTADRLCHGAAFVVCNWQSYRTK